MEPNRYLGPSGHEKFGADMMQNAMGMFQMRNQWASKLLGQSNNQNQNTVLTDLEAMDVLKNISKKIDRLSDEVESGNRDYSTLEDQIDTLSVELSDAKLLKTEVHQRKQKKLSMELEELREQVEELRREAKKNKKKLAITATVEQTNENKLKKLEREVEKVQAECLNFQGCETDESYKLLHNNLQQISRALTEFNDGTNEEQLKAADLVKSVRKYIIKLNAKAIENEEVKAQQSNNAKQSFAEQCQLPVASMNFGESMPSSAMGSSMSSMMAGMNIGNLANQNQLLSGMQQPSMMRPGTMMGGQSGMTAGIQGLLNQPGITKEVSVKQEIRGPQGYKKVEGKFEF